MKFLIARTSQPSNQFRPCEEALQDENERWYVEAHTINKLMYFLQKYGTLILDHNGDGEPTILIDDDWSHEA